jgi:myosin-18
MLIVVMHCYFRFDLELHSLQEDLKKEKAQREKIAREKDMAMSDKFSMEQSLSVIIS